MSNRNLVILGFVALVMVALAVAVSNFSNKVRVTATAPTYLIQGLDLDQITGITIGTGDKQVILTRRGSNFFVASKDNYPALNSKINRLITTCLDIQTTELYTDNPANHKDLGVTEEEARSVVKFYKTDSSLLAGVIISKPSATSRTTYVRQADDSRVYVTQEAPRIKNRSLDYIDQALINVNLEDIKSVTVSYPDETYLLLPGTDNKPVTMENLLEGKKLKEDLAGKVLNALANLTFDDVNTESARTNLVFDRRHICRLKDSTAYTFWLTKDGDGWFAKCDAQFEDQTPVTKTQGQVETEEQLKEKEAKLLARDAAEEFSDVHKGWVYRIPSHRAQNLTIPLANLLEDLPQEKPISEPNQTTPEELIEQVRSLAEPNSAQ